jgi:hypothetical protein
MASRTNIKASAHFVFVAGRREMDQHLHAPIKSISQIMACPITRPISSAFTFAKIKNLNQPSQVGFRLTGRSKQKHDCRVNGNNAHLALFVAGHFRTKAG